MKRILVPTDFSTPSLAALTQAVHYTQAVGGELLLLHVVEGAPLRWYAVDGLPEAPSTVLDPTAHLMLPQPSQTRVARDLVAEAEWKLAALLPPYGQNIRTRLPTGGCASTIAGASACLPLHAHPYLALRGTAKVEGRGHGLETPAGVYHWNCRSRTAVAQ